MPTRCRYWVSYLDKLGLPHAAGPFDTEEQALLEWLRLRGIDQPTLVIVPANTEGEAEAWLQ